jgi:hypothetical protein
MNEEFHRLKLKCEFEDPWLQGANSKGTHLQGFLGQLKNELSKSAKLG